MLTSVLKRYKGSLLAVPGVAELSAEHKREIAGAYEAAGIEGDHVDELRRAADAGQGASEPETDKKGKRAAPEGSPRPLKTSKKAAKPEAGSKEAAVRRHARRPRLALRR